MLYYYGITGISPAEPCKLQYNVFTVLKFY